MSFLSLSKHLWKENWEKKKIADFFQDFLHVMHLIPVNWFGFLSISDTFYIPSIYSMLWVRSRHL